MHLVCLVFFFVCLFVCFLFVWFFCCCCFAKTKFSFCPIFWTIVWWTSLLVSWKGKQITAVCCCCQLTFSHVQDSKKTIWSHSKKKCLQVVQNLLHGTTLQFHRFTRRQILESVKLLHQISIQGASVTNDETFVFRPLFQHCAVHCQQI